MYMCATVTFCTNHAYTNMCINKYRLYIYTYVFVYVHVCMLHANVQCTTSNNIICISICPCIHIYKQSNKYIESDLSSFIRGPNPPLPLNKQIEWGIGYNLSSRGINM